jgi:hypothetical protein
MRLRSNLSAAGPAAVIAVLAMAASIAGQTPPAARPAPKAAKPYTPPKTPDGQPDLQGYWTNSTYTPLERPANVNKEFYTPDELAALVKKAAAGESEQTTPGTVADVHYDFSQFGLDRSQSTLASNLRTSLIVDPPDGKIPALSPEGQKIVAARAEAARGVGRWDAAQTNQLDDRCLMMNGAGPPMMDAGYNSNYHIVQAPGYVMILTEMIHDARIIPLAPDAQPPATMRQWIGFSRGHWEGNTLVVETTNFNGKNPFRGSTEKMRVTERFTRVADDVIQYRFTIDDSAMWTRPWTAEMPMQKTSGPIFEHACHEGNYGLYNTLAGARLEEKKAAEAAARQPK